VYSSDEDSESAAEADIDAVQAELEHSWEHNQPSGTGTIRQRRRHSSGTSRGKGALRDGRYDDDTIYDTSTVRRQQTLPSQQGFYPREADVDEVPDEDRPQSRLNRNQDDDDEDETSSEGVPDSEASYTLKDRQDAINITHPFGLKIWKPALYKKDRSVQRTAEGEIHSRPGQWPDRKIRLGNVLWTVIFGWWMCIVTAIVALILLASTWWSGGAPYAFVLFGLARYLFYPFGRFIELTPNEAYAVEDEGEGRSISEYERYGAVDLERGRQLGIFTSSPVSDHRRGLIGRRRGQSIESWGEYSERDSLLGGGTEHAATEGEEDSGPGRKRRLFGRGQWSLGRIIFFISYYLVIGMSFENVLTVAPILLFVCGICWLAVFALPMAKVMSVIASHLRRHPLSMTFHSDLRTAASRRPGTPSAQVLLCTYRAWGWEYYKYTIDGTNIFFVNLIFVVFFTIADEFFLAPLFHHKYWFVHPGLIFALALASIVPLAYFIGMAVASISAQSSMGMGAAINAFFGSVVEVFLYSVALTQGKSRLVEGSVIGSIFAGTLMMPGISMLFGALRRKTQRFNAKSAGVTSTMLLFSVIGAFAPTLFYQIYGTVRLCILLMIV
jgi:Ca2+:H+ antiporter